jgi:hypothetical protein
MTKHYHFTCKMYKEALGDDNDKDSVVPTGVRVLTKTWSLPQDGTTVLVISQTHASAVLASTITKVLSPVNFGFSSTSLTSASYAIHSGYGGSDPTDVINL